MNRTHDCDIDCFREREARRELQDAPIVEAAKAALSKCDFDDPNVHEVMSRRAGSIGDYADVKDLYATAVAVVIHAGKS